MQQACPWDISQPRIMLHSRLAGGPSREDVTEDVESLSRFRFAYDHFPIGDIDAAGGDYRRADPGPSVREFTEDGKANHRRHHELPI
jgi:hypothetical protein